MIKKICLIIALSIATIVIIPLKVNAVNPTITITVSAFVTVGSPSGLTLTYINDTQVDLSWNLGAGATNTMVRAAYGHIPTDITDGRLVYQGAATNASDTGYSLDDILVSNLTGEPMVYYRAWSQNGLGVWETIGTSKEGDFMSQSFIWIGLVIIAIAFIVLAAITKKVIFGVLSAMGWVGAGVFLVSNATPATIGTNWIITVIFWLAALGSMAASYSMRDKPVIVPPKVYTRNEVLSEYYAQVSAARRGLSGRSQNRPIDTQIDRPR